MGASKTKQYPSETLHLAKLAKALAHPARITIVKVLRDKPFCRNIDFQSILQLSKGTVHDHLLQLKKAKLVEFQYYPNEYRINLIPEHLEDLDYFLRE
jgi:DNA-binding transcriptional ArsR family regulator